MRVGLLILVVALGIASCGRTQHGGISALPVSGMSALANPPRAVAVPPKVDFATQIKPIFEARCQPCHFAGGTMYEHLPFDQQETITTLGTKLFTRIKDENERRLIREFLSQK